MGRDPVYILDVSRLLSRLGKGALTGIDRVEAAWLQRLAPLPHLLIARVGGDTLLLPPKAGLSLSGWINGDTADLPPLRLQDRLRRRPELTARAGRALHGMALTRRPGDFRAAITRRDPRASWVYLNVGHGAIADDAWRALAWTRRAVMIHDTIPLDHPEFTRKGQSQVFRNRLSMRLSGADRVLAISDHTADRVAEWARRLSLPRTAPIIVAPIGTTPTHAGNEPPAIPTDRPFFLTVGTIEPRKNHAMLLDVWDRLARSLPASRVPRLIIAGRRGWENAVTFARLDRLPRHSPVIERADLSDADIAWLMDHAYALLMPSFAEGFGLPMTEAAARGLPVLASPLPTAAEFLPDHATILPVDHPAAWADAIADLSGRTPRRLPPAIVPTWETHFRIVDAAMRGDD